MNTKVTLAGVELKNPVMTASGTFGSGAEYSEFVDLNRLGAVVTKGVANVPWPGNPTPRIAEVHGGMLNAIGLQNPGIDVFVKRDIPFLKQYDTKIIVNVCGKTTEDNGAAGAGSAHPAYGPGRLAKRRRSKGLAVDRYRVVQDPWFPPLCGKCLCHGKGLPWGVPPVRSPRADNHISLDAFRTSIAAIQSYLCQTGRGLQSCLCYVNCLPHPIHLYPSFT